MYQTTFEKADKATITAAFTAAYTGYFYPLAFSEESTANYIHVHDIAPVSPLWMRDGRPVAVGALGIRGERAWVGAFGIAPEYRGKGLAQGMFGEIVRLAKKHGAKRMSLEVLKQNARARAIYERAGFKHARTLVSLDGTVPVADAGTACEAPVRSLIARPVADAPQPCWQREMRSLELRAHQLSGMIAGKSFAVYRGDAEIASIWKAELAGDDADEVLRGVAFRTVTDKLSISNEPDGSPLLMQLLERLWVPAAEQSEMHLTL